MAAVGEVEAEAPPRTLDVGGPQSGGRPSFLYHGDRPCAEEGPYLLRAEPFLPQVCGSCQSASLALVSSNGRPTQIQVERSSGFERLDSAAREAVEKALFHPHEINGVAQPAQVLIPIEFARRAS